MEPQTRSQGEGLPTGYARSPFPRDRRPEPDLQPHVAAGGLRPRANLHWTSPLGARDDRPGLKDPGGVAPGDTLVALAGPPGPQSASPDRDGRRHWNMRAGLRVLREA